MRRQQPRQWRTFFALGLALSLVAASCGDDDDGGGDGDEEAGRICSLADAGMETAAAPADDGDDTAEEGGIQENSDAESAPGFEPVSFVAQEDFSGQQVTVFGVEVGVEGQSLDETFDDFRADTGIDVQVNGSDDFEEQVLVDIEGGSPPDIGLFPQPGTILNITDEAAPLSDDVLAEVGQNYDEGWTNFIEVEGDVIAVPVKADLKSLVWYSPSTFEGNGYEIPETLDDFLGLACQMVDDGNTPFCAGWESEGATGWPATDWVEDFMLRLKGPELYDQWWQHEIPADHPDVVEVGQFVVDFLSQDGFVAGGLESAATNSFREAGLGVLDGQCMMYRISNFYGSILSDPELGLEDTELGPDGDADAFYLPGSEENPNITLTGGMYAVAFSDEPAVMETLRFMASSEYADTRAANPIGGFLSPNANIDTSQYGTDQEQTFGEILTDAEPVRFDASDLMPSEVGSGSLWTAMINVSTGAQTVEEAFADVEASWED